MALKGQRFDMIQAIKRKSLTRFAKCTERRIFQVFTKLEERLAKMDMRDLRDKNRAGATSPYTLMYGAERRTRSAPQ
ncbi:hypothetical protein LAZ67_3002912 [Cordylochernes scorpioides]|uniref:Uncharacterized protein n=1 Tax=Cordylochernes scorpioides TaxID=51811 RepID=A0ABY6K8Z4_9ARAC|nr:hypothetical protein LAZ67_3002912 [Cordylochernes scorpioides]